MSAETLEILEPGILTTVQDRGRYGYQRFGVPVSGAMDAFAMRAANILVGNDEGAAGLEMTVLGPRIKFLSDTWFALTGADLSPVSDREPVPLWEPVLAVKDSILAFQGVRDGLRCYLAILGGIDVPLVMGSRSTYLKGAIGGLDGRALSAGDVLSALDMENDEWSPEGGQHNLSETPSYGHEHEIRIILGPQDDAFTSDGISTFLNSEYSVSSQSDRMGYRLEGPSIEHVSGPDIVSDGTPLGAVQVPGDGRPIILLADRGTTGGYTKIATVVSADISKLAQAMPGDTVRFKAVSIEEANMILLEQEMLIQSIGKSKAFELPPRFRIVSDGQPFDVVDEAGLAVTLPFNTDGMDIRQRSRVTATVNGNTFEFEVEVQQPD